MFVGTARIPDQVDRPITDEEVARMMGGAYRLASIAVDLKWTCSSGGRDACQMS
ncbi:hypothetical protein [Bradyrhizobium sp. USDA 223]|uniref:hypothetical protein n=1 Tax=Bradyrhizobium sp. USDA 223 TaxID=3156306 RepID=UPI0038375713